MLFSVSWKSIHMYIPLWSVIFLILLNWKLFCIGSVISCASCWGFKGRRLLLFTTHMKVQRTEIFLIYVLLYIRAMKLGLSVVMDNLQDSFEAKEDNFLCPQQHHCCLVNSDWHFEHEKAKLQIKGFECLYLSGERAMYPRKGEAVGWWT